MQFLIHWEVKPEHRNQVLERFQSKQEDAHPGVKMLGAWHAVTQEEGWAVTEAEDLVELGKWLYQWTDLNVNHVTPVVNDAQMHEIVGT